MATKKSRIAKPSLIAGALSASLLSQNIAEGQTNLQTAQLLRNTDQIVDVDATTTFASKYVKAGGGVVGKGPVDQTTLNLNLGRYITGTIWTDQNFGNGGKLDEIDMDISMHSKLGQITEGPFKGTFSGSLGFQNWRYPSVLEGKHEDYMLLPAITYKGPITITLVDFHSLDDRWTWDRNCLMLDASKSLDLGTVGNNRFSISPGIRTAYNDDFAKGTGIRYVAPEFAVSWSYGAWSSNCFVRDQFSTMKGVPNLVYFGISLSVSDLREGIRELGGLVRK